MKKIIATARVSLDGQVTLQLMKSEVTPTGVIMATYEKAAEGK